MITNKVNENETKKGQQEHTWQLEYLNVPVILNNILINNYE